MKIDIAGPMVAAHSQDDVDTYTPVADGRELRLEHGCAETTLANLKDLLVGQREVVSLFAKHRRVLVTFNTGESYLATGFWVGNEAPEVQRLAEFAMKHKLGGSAGSWKDLFAWYSTLDMDYAGPLRMPDVGFVNEDSGVIASDETTPHLRIR